MDNAVQPVEEVKAMQIHQSPDDVTAEAQVAAKKLMEIVRQNNWAVKVNQGEHLKFEAWQTLGKFYGLTVKTESTQYVEFGNAKGFEAKVIVLNSQGETIGGAESMCLSDEKNWTGKPLFSLRSMAQTRACGKALRQLLGWVAVLAGYKATPAEEMDHLRNTDPSREAIQDVKKRKEESEQTDTQDPEWVKGDECENCGNPLTEKVKEYSMEHYNGRKLCYKCQKEVV